MNDDKPSGPRVRELLARPAHQRKLEYKYGCAQAIVFGLPVIALQYFGRALGGDEAPRWVAILQAILTGWVAYVAAAGMLFEGLLTFPRASRFPDLLVAIVGLGAYLYSAFSVVAVFITGRLAYQPLLFHIVVILLGIWTGIRWWQFRSS